MGFQSLTALQEAEARSSGELWLSLLTINHPQLADPIRLVSPRATSIVSNSDTFLPTRFDVVLQTDQFDQPTNLQLSVEGTSGVLLAFLQVARQPPTATLQLIMEDSPDDIQLEAPDFEMVTLEQIGVSTLNISLIPTRYLTLPFPGLNMDRKRVPGIFLDT